MIRQTFAVAALLAFSGVQAAPVLLGNANDASLAGATTVTFDSEALGSFTTRAFDNGAFTVSSAGTLYVQNGLSGSYGASGRYLTNQSTPNPITVDFAGSVSAFGFNWGAADQPWTLEVFDAADGLIATLNLAAQGGSYAGFVGVDGGGAGIGSFRLTTLSNYGYDYVLMDNLKYVAGGNNNNVPEPQSLALASLALAAAGAAARKTKRRAAPGRNA